MTSQKVRITARAAILLGLDDTCRYPDVRREWNGTHVYLTASVDTLGEINTEFHNRATEDHTGFDHTAKDKRIAVQAVRGLLGQGIPYRL